MKRSDLQSIRNTLEFAAEKGKFSNKNTEHIYREVKRSLELIDAEMKLESTEDTTPPFSINSIRKEVNEINVSIEKFTKEGHQTMASMCIGQRNALLMLLEKVEN